MRRALRLAEQMRSVRLRRAYLERAERLLAECPDAPDELRERIDRLQKGI